MMDPCNYLNIVRTMWTAVQSSRNELDFLSVKYLFCVCVCVCVCVCLHASACACVCVWWVWGGGGWEKIKKEALLFSTPLYILL